MSSSESSHPLPPTADIIEEPDKSLKIGGIYVPPPPIPALTTDPREPRLIITELIIKNFKSYAGEERLGPFHKNFTSVVGPNGSGKSNVIDALLFVFGYRAQKIRSKKISILVHKSEKFSNVNSCTVTVRFAKIKDLLNSYEVLPGSSFSISRTGYKDNSSSYDINGKRAQFKDVSNLLQKHGIDLEYSRFLILQGEIELIAMMKPKAQTEQSTGLLEYMEDIVGSNRYIEPIQHFVTKVQEFNDIKNEKANQLSIIEHEMKDIEGPKNEAVEYLKLENKTITIENSIIQVKLKDVNSELETITSERNELDKKMKDCALKQEEIQLKVKLKESQMEKLVSSYEQYVEVVDSLKEEYNKLEREDVVCREKLNFTKEKIKKLVKNLDTEEQTLKNLKKQPIILKSEATELESKLKNLESRKKIEDKKMTEVMGTLKQETQDMQEEKDNLELQLMELKTASYQSKSDLDIAQSELTIYLSDEKKEQEKLTALMDEFEKVGPILDEKAEVLKEAELRVPEAENKLALSKQQLSDTEISEQKLSFELGTKRVKVEELKSSFNSIKNQSAMMQAFLDEKQKGRLTGVYGRLGDLGTITEKYDVAISTACGSLDHIVTDTLATAQECVQYLKANNLGYATFIALEKMTHWEPYTRSKISTPENVPRLFDLISVPNRKILPAFYFALRDTLVSNDLEQATRIGLQGTTRYRMVTLKGELIDLSGTMSGGGGRVLKGKMGQRVVSYDVSPQELSAMVAEVEDLKKNVAQLRTSKMTLEEAIDSLTKEIRALRHSIVKSKLEYNAYTEKKDLLAKKIASQKKKVNEVAPDPKVITNMEKKITEKKKKYEKDSKASDTIDVKVKSLQDKIMFVTKGKFKSAQKGGEKITKEIDDVRQAMTKTSVTIKSAERKVKKCEEKVESLQQSIEELKKTKETLRAEFDSLAEKATVIVEKRNAALKNVEESEGQKAEISKEVQAMNKNEHQLKSDYIEHRNNYKRTESQIKDKQAHIKSLKIKLSKLKLHDVEEEGVNTLPTLTEEEVATISVNALSHEMGIIQAQMESMKPDLNAIYEYKRKEEIYKMKKNDLDETVKQRDLHKYYYEELRMRRLGEFMRGFSLIATKLKEMYQMLTLGGDAELELVDSLDPFSEGISFSVRPPKKSWKSIGNLSGGEKTLSSLALVFALHYYRPTPFYVMDEIDAALDFRNVSIVGCYVKQRTKNAQFIIISLRNTMFELCNHLIGIFKTDNCTGQISLMDIDRLTLSAKAGKGSKIIEEENEEGTTG